MDDCGTKMVSPKCSLIASCVGLYNPLNLHNPPAGAGGYGDLATEATGISRRRLRELVQGSTNGQGSIGG